MSPWRRDPELTSPVLRQYKEEWEALRKRMTIGIAFACQEGIVLASDSRSGSGDFSTPKGKIHQIGEHCGLVCTGAHQVGQRLAATLNDLTPTEKDVEYYKSQLEPLAMRAVSGSTPILEELEPWIKQWKDKGYPPSDVTEAITAIQHVYAGYFHHAVLLAGIARGSGPMIYRARATANAFSPLPETAQWGVIGAETIAGYWMDRLVRSGWHPGTASMATLDVLAMFLVKETAALSGKVELPLQLVHITPHGGFQELIPPPPTPPNDYHKELEDKCDQLIEQFCDSLRAPPPDSNA